MKKPHLTLNHGSALLLVLWAIVTMSLAVLGVVEYVHYNLDEATGMNRDFRVRQLAESGLAIAMSPQVAEDDPLLEGEMEDEGSYKVRLDSESARLNINFLIKTGNEDLVQRMFETWKVPTSEATMVVNELIDWMGRTGDAPENFAVEREFKTVAEMAQVASMSRVARRQPDWSAAFTVWGDGRLDLNKASADVLKGFFGISDRQAESFVQYRLGPDKTENTLDDQPYKDMKVVAGALGMSQEKFEDYAQLVTLQGQITRVESTGTLGNTHKTLRVVMNRQAQPPVIYLWEEVQL